MPISQGVLVHVLVFVAGFGHVLVLVLEELKTSLTLLE
jgi:hypothetical protein